MKSKFICLLTVLFYCSLIASPRRCTCNSVTCTEKKQSKVQVTKVKPAMMMLDETELLPIHNFLNNF